MTRITFTRIEAGTQKPAVDERVLLMVPDAPMIGKSDVEVGFWDGHHFRFTRGQDQVHLVTRWARLEPCLPKPNKRTSIKASKSR
jgi:hypothetical protein